MTLTVHPLNIRDLTYVIANMRQADWRELKAQIPVGMTKQEASNHIVSTITGPSFSVQQNGQPIAVFGASHTGIPSVFVVYAFGTNKFRRAAPIISDFSLNILSHELVKMGGLRLEVRAHKEHTEANKWLEKVGFKKECECEYFGVNGETFVQYSMTIKDYYTRFKPVEAKQLQ